MDERDGNAIASLRSLERQNVSSSDCRHGPSYLAIPNVNDGSLYQTEAVEDGAVDMTTKTRMRKTM